MIDVAIPAPMLWLLRWALLLAPLAAVLVLGYRNRSDERALVGGLFAFLYGLGLIFVTHQFAIAVGWWRYGGDVLMVMGLPADIWIGGALLFGPVLYLAFPTVAPVWLVLPVVIAQGIVFASLKPLVIGGNGWFLGVVLVVVTAHLPALYLARWTARDECLPLRASLLAIAYGALAFGALPSLIMQSLWGGWRLNASWLLALCAAPFGICMVIGLSAVQSFVVEGHGTPIPLDPTKRLVRTGLFAYVTNSMQLSTAVAWIIMGVVLRNPWVALASVMAWVFVQGMVRWHHRNDLELRFPEGWPTYRAHVPEWIPRWTPWTPEPAALRYDPSDYGQARFARWLRKRLPTGLETIAEPNLDRLIYISPNEVWPSEGLAAVAKCLNHINFVYALMGAAMRLVVLPGQMLCAVIGRLMALRSA